MIAVVGTVALVSRIDDPVGAASDRLSEFTNSGTEPNFEGGRLTGSSFSSYRADYWSVAWNSFTRHPVIGVGADNFARDYAPRGKSEQTPKYPHSTEFRVLSQTGLIGVLLFGGGLAAALAAALPAVRRGRGIGAAAAGIGLVPFAYWIVHGSLDWLFEYPVLSCAAFAFLGLSGAVSAGMFPTRSKPLPARRALAVAGVALASALAVAVGLAWLAERDLRNAREQARSNPAGALSLLDRSSRLNGLSPDAEKTAGLIEVSRGDLRGARDSFEEALRRDPGDSFTLMELAAIASVETRRPDARRLMARARALAPRDRVVRRVGRAIGRGDVVSPVRVGRLVLEAIDVRIGPGT